ncbi:ankyrin repeat domain-containing protein 26-like [Eulemur rufifrons]|uniref:ankyrin repeat domain-containing protein 26-like n=1 Tax=Eulemur rufifrons TaxID=859984 RepID=UPI00374259F4
MNSHANNLFQLLHESESKFRRLQVEFRHTRDALQEKILVLEGAQRDLRETEFQRKEMGRMFQGEQDKVNKYIIKQESLEERLSEEQRKNMLLQQQLDHAHKEVANKDKTLTTNQHKFHATVKTLEAESKMHSLLLEEKNQKLMHECNRLKERMYQHEKEKVEREAVVRQLRQELVDTVQKLSGSQTSLEIKSCCHAHLEDEAQNSQKQLSQANSQLQEAHNQLKETGRRAEKLEDHRTKLKIENTKLKVTIKEQADKLEQREKHLLSASSVQKCLADQLTETLRWNKKMEDHMQKYN